MNNVISLSSSPATAGTRGSPALGRSSSPDFPTLEQLLSQEKPVSRPARSHASDARLKSIEGGRDGKAAERKAIPVDGAPEPDVAADASLVEIPAADVVTGPQPKTTKSKKAPAGRKTSRTKAKSSASTRALPENATPQENAEDTTTSKPPKPRRKQTGAISRHFKSQPEPAPPKEPAEDPDEPLNIETALGRRADWTPPPKDSLKEFGSRSSDIIELLSSANKAEGAEKSEIFRSLKETYGYELEDDPFPSADRQTTDALFKKRKLIEMVSTSNGANAMAPPPPPPESSPTKQKAPKKKARTITELATAAYEQTEPELPPPGPADPPAPEPAGAVGPGKPKPKTKRKPKAPKKKDEPHMVVYSPEAALVQVAQQDFVFGTSSQLAREQDPQAGGLLRLRDSMPLIEEEEYVTPINSDAIEPPEVLPKLWTAAARDADGELLHLEVIDLAKDSSPRGEAVSDDSDPFGYVNPERASQWSSKQGSSARAARASSSAPKSTEQANPRPSLKALSQGITNKQLESASGVVRDPLLGVVSSASPPPSSQKRLSSIYKSSSHPAQPSPSPTKSAGYTAPEKPRFELYTDAQLASQVAAYGFKPIKKRAGMVSLLDQCWMSKYQRQGARAYSTASSAVAEAPVEAEAVPEVASRPATEPVKRPRGRPRKNSTVTAPKRPSPEPAVSPVPEKRPRGRPRKTTAPPAPKKSSAKPAPSTPKKNAPVLEIPDSDTSPSTASSIFSSPPAHDISLDDSLALAPAAEESSTLHDAITKAVTSAPRSGDPAAPSWHERMLMYESVIVEDLAAWLNTGALDGVGFDGEVSAGEVKGWCESRSVCCVWRTRMGGEERKRL